MNAEELINELLKVPRDTEIKLGVHYDNCLHLQYAGSVFYFEPGNWLTIEGEKGGF